MKDQNEHNNGHNNELNTEKKTINLPKPYSDTLNKRRVGDAYEIIACKYLARHGVSVTERNFRVRQGEIDIIGYDGNTLVFFEVKYRKNKAMGLAEDAVGYKKQKQICRVSRFYLNRYRISNATDIRFDVITVYGESEVSIHWYKGAFYYIE